MALRLKRDPKGARIAGIKPEMLVAIAVANEVFNQHGQDCVVTACTDGKHGDHSLHAFGYAVDLRTRSFAPEKINTIAQLIARRLSTEYDIVIESDHLHVEFDPR